MIKRYNLQIESMSVDLFERCLSTMCLPDPVEVENPEGKWVKFEDICPLCRGIGDHDIAKYYKD